MTSAISAEQATEKAATDAVVEAKEITRVYGEGEPAVRALNDCSVDVDRGQLTAVMGPSGSGKSTMMHILAGLDHPTEGSVSIEGADITKLNDNELTKLRREHIGDFGQTIVMVTHDARAAAIASRVLFLADGCIAKELKGADQSEIVGAVDAVSRQ